MLQILFLLRSTWTRVSPFCYSLAITKTCLQKKKQKNYGIEYISELQAPINSGNMKVTDA